MITALPRVAIAVRDMDRAIEVFRGAFAMPVHEFAWAPRELGGRMALCTPRGGSHIELVAPSDPDRPHSRSFLRFLERRGEGLFALMLHAPDPDLEAAELERRGLEVLPRMEEAGGRDIHPANTCGVLVRIYPEHSRTLVEPELARELGSPSLRSVGTGLSGIQRVLVAVRDLDTAIAVYRDRLGLETILPPLEPGAEARRAICAPREGARIELLAPVGSGGPIARFLHERGEGMYALVLESDDLDATVRALWAKEVPVRRVEGDAAAWEIDRGAAFGALIRLEGRWQASEGGRAWT
jgi:catechol 2,3-dioxygenase-like lactoylglutathione lyase family enzyme